MSQDNQDLTVHSNIVDTLFSSFLIFFLFFLTFQSCMKGQETLKKAKQWNKTRIFFPLLLKLLSPLRPKRTAK